MAQFLRSLFKNYVGKKQLFIHIGTQKTGTTTIQSILSKNKKILLKEGISYLGRFEKLSRDIRELKEYDTKYANKLRDATLAEIHSKQHKKSHTFVISNEKYSGDKMISHRNAGIIARLLKEAFDPLHFNIKIIVFLRRQDVYIESTYVQKIYSGSSDTFEEFFDQFDENDFHWDEFLDLYANVFGAENMIVRGFDRKYLPHKNSLIQTFGGIIGSNFLQNYSETVVQNKGFSRDAMEIMRIANRHFEKKEKQYLREVIRKADLREAKPLFFNNSQRKKILANYQESNQRVAIQYLSNQTESLFSTPKYLPEHETIKVEPLTLDIAVTALSKSVLDFNMKLRERQLKANKSNKFKRLIKTIGARFH